MMKSLFYFLLPIFGLFSSTCYTTEFSEYPITSEETGQITIHNRILTKFNNKTYSVLDVVKKMDMIFDSYYPQFAHSKLARYQFYNAQWKDTLQKMLDQELILLDAERIGVKATDAEVREELLRKYGPNVITSLDRLKLSYEEARKMISEDLIAEKTLYFKVYSEALRVRPNDIKEKYIAYCKKNPALQKWCYQVLTIRSEDENVSEGLAKLAFDLLKEKRDLSDISKNLQSENPNTTVLFTPEIISDNASISQAHKMVIETLNPGDFSAPISQVNKDQSIVHRIFYLKEKDVIHPPEFPKLAEKIKDGLIQESIALHLLNYMKKLKARYGFSEQDVSSDFKPFSYQ
ncbi:MAG: hypothetical protein ACH349_04870 [Candidatus Rhabdochlamydia sp.]|nr:hypothetical protein [Chlamydiota bacterium]